MAGYSPPQTALTWTMPPGHPECTTTRAQDIANLHASKVSRVQVVYHPNELDYTLQILRTEGIQFVTIRLDEEAWATPLGRATAMPFLRRAKMVHPGFDTLLFGVEVDSPYTLTFSSPDWGQEHAEAMRDALVLALFDFGPLDVQLASPALSYRGHYRDWREGLQPGWFRWWEIMRPALNECDINQIHLYGSDGTAYDTLERLRVGLWLGESLANKNAHIGELNCLRGTDIEQMTFIVRFLSLLLWTDPTHPQRGPWAGSGARIAGVAPFTANGTGKDWPPNYLITDLAAYQLLGRFMAGERFYY